MRYYDTDAYFRLKEWPRSSNYGMYYNDRYARSEFKEVIDYISDILYTTKVSLIRHSMFTLANVAFPKSQVSYGYIPHPHKSLYGLSDFVFTFAFTKRKPITKIKPRFSIRLGLNTMLWGNSIRNSTDYLTIAIPFNMASRMNLRHSLRDVEFLYYTIGPWSKNFVREHKYYIDYKYGRYNNEPAVPNAIFGRSIPDVLENETYDNWLYSYEMWKRLPSILSPNYVTPRFSEFYCKNLITFYKKLKVKSVAEIEDKIYQLVESEYIDFLSYLNGSFLGNTAPISGFSILLGRALNREFNTLQEAASYINDNELEKSPLYNHDIIENLLRGKTLTLEKIK